MKNRITTACLSFLLAALVGCSVPTVRVPSADDSPPVVDFVYSSSFRQVGYFPADGTLSDIRAGDVIGPSENDFKIVEPADHASLAIMARARDPESGIQQQYTQHWFRIQCNGRGLSDRSETERSEYSAGSIEVGDELPTTYGQVVSFRVSDILDHFDCPREGVELISLQIQSFADNGAPDSGATTETFGVGIFPTPVSPSSDGNGPEAPAQAVVSLDLREYCGNCSTCAVSVDVNAEYSGTLVPGTTTGDGSRETSFSHTSLEHTAYRESTFDDEGEEICYYDHRIWTVTDLEPGTWNLQVVNGGPHTCNGIVLREGIQTVRFGVDGCDD